MFSFQMVVFAVFFFLSFFLSFLSFFLPSSSSLSLRSAVGQQEKIVYIMGKPHQKLAQGFEYVVTPTEYADAWGSSRVGNALAILVPVLFSPEDLQRSSIKELDQNKISALIGEPFSLPLFFFHFSFFIFPFFFSKCGLVFSPLVLQIAFCLEKNFAPRVHNGDDLGMAQSVRLCITERMTKSRKDPKE